MQPGSIVNPSDLDSYIIVQCVLVGDSGTGKSAFMQRGVCFAHSWSASRARLSIQSFNNGQMHKLYYKTPQRGLICFHVWEVSGHETIDDFRGGTTGGADCAIVMFDLTAPETYRSVTQWRHKVREFAGEDIPMLVCGSKFDIQDPAGPRIGINPRRKGTRPYMEVSAKDSQSADDPFLYLARRLLCYQLSFMRVTDIAFDHMTSALCHHELTLCSPLPLPEEDDDL